MNRYTKIIIFCLFIVLAMTMLSYGLFEHSQVVLLPADANEAVLTKAELRLIKDVTIGGVEKDESGNLRQTYSDITKAAAACPT